MLKKNNNILEFLESRIGTTKISQFKIIKDLGSTFIIEHKGTVWAIDKKLLQKCK